MGVLLGVSTKTKHSKFHIIQQPIWLYIVPIIVRFEHQLSVRNGH